ncbi:MAG: hypothetical protein ACFFDP_05590 [Promethearchaeota archaeon]
MVLVEEISWKTCSIDTNPINLEISPETENENLREIGAIGSLLIELIRQNCGLTGQITIEESEEGIRIRIDSNEKNLTAFAQTGGI